MSANTKTTGAGPTAPVMSRLLAATKAYHARMEAMPYFTTLMAHRLPLACYVHQLQALAVIHAVLETEIGRTSIAEVKTIYHPGLAKLPLLEADLLFFRPRYSAAAPKVMAQALAMADSIRIRKNEQPLSLLGCLYVLEGSTLGNHMHRKDIVANFHLEGEAGSRYYASYGKEVVARWQRFSQIMNATIIEPESQALLETAAVEVFVGLEKLYGLLYPGEKTVVSAHVAVINPEAGNHPIPDDPREVAAALKASDLLWGAFAYYSQRYGERGKRFSDSDSCWLATLAGLDQESLAAQVDWLARVLAHRGMPRLLLERSLMVLAQELTGAVPARAADYDRLYRAAANMEQARFACLPEAQWQPLAEKFAELVSQKQAGDAENTGLLLVAAVVDEYTGIRTGDAGFIGWHSADGRFPGEWRAAVAETVAEVRDLIAEFAGHSSCKKHEEG